MNLQTVTLEHGARFGKLTVLGKVKTKRGIKYRVGCECGNSKTLLRAPQLMKGRITACLKCSA